MNSYDRIDLMNEEQTKNFLKFFVHKQAKQLKWLYELKAGFGAREETFEDWRQKVIDNLYEMEKREKEKND